MENSIGSRLKRAWNVLRDNEDTIIRYPEVGSGYSYRPDRPQFSRGNERSIVNSVYNRIATDAATITVQHVRTDSDGNYVSTIDSRLNDCLNFEANIDQTGQAFIQDCVMSMLDEGSVAIVPVETIGDPLVSGSYDILSLRTAKIIEWYPRHVKVHLYDDRSGNKKDLVLPKSFVSIIENPFYSVMNEPNSTLQRLIRKLSLLDAVDEQSSSGKLDLIIQLPYVVKTPLRKAEAENRRIEVEKQLTGSKYGIAYTDGSERITQLNRPVENNLMKQIEYLTGLLYSQLGINQSVLDGTADDKAMTNYYSRTIDPILAAVVHGMRRSFLTKTARTQGQSIMYFRDLFRLVPVADLAEMADKLTRNEIMSSNEFRQKMAMKPSDDPRADKLENKNINNASAETSPSAESKTEEENQNGEV